MPYLKVEFESANHTVVTEPVEAKLKY
jgi:hypothetical protein